MNRKPMPNMTTEEQQDFQIALQCYLEHLNKLYAGKYTSLFLYEDDYRWHIGVTNACQACDHILPCKHCSKEFLASKRQAGSIIVVDKLSGNCICNGHLRTILGNILHDIPANIKPPWPT